MFVRWKKRRLTAAFLWANGRFTGHGRIAVRAADGSEETWNGGVLQVRSPRTAGERWHRMEVRNIGMGGAYVDGDVERWSYHAQLVESRRVNGQPRQHVVAHLVSYQTGDPDDAERRVMFWKQVDDRLATLNLPDAVQARIREALAQRMPWPTPQDQQAADERELTLLRLRAGMM